MARYGFTLEIVTNEQFLQGPRNGVGEFLGDDPILAIDATAWTIGELADVLGLDRGDGFPLRSAEITACALLDDYEEGEPA